MTKNGKKLKPCLIIKGIAFNGARECCRNTVVHELLNRLKDNHGNSYPPEDKMHLTCNETRNFNSNLTKVVLERSCFYLLRLVKVIEGVC